MSKNAGFNNDNNKTRKKKILYFNSVLPALLALPLSPGFSQLMIDNVLLSLTLGLHMPLWGDLGVQPLGPGTPLGSFERGKKKGQKGPWVGAGPTGTKQLESLMQWKFVPGPGTGSSDRGWQGGLSVPPRHPFLCPCKKGNNTEISKDQHIWNQWNPSTRTFLSDSYWLSLKFLKRRYPLLDCFLLQNVSTNNYWAPTKFQVLC